MHGLFLNESGVLQALGGLACGSMKAFFFSFLLPAWFFRCEMSTALSLQLLTADSQYPFKDTFVFMEEFVLHKDYNL